MKRIVCSLLMVTVCMQMGMASAETNKQSSIWFVDVEEAIKTAQKEKLPILLSFSGSDWCRYCIVLDEQVFQKQEFKDYAVNSFIPVNVDFPNDKSKQAEKIQKQNVELATDFGVEGFPSLMLVEEDGKTPLGSIQFSGDMGPRQFIAQANSMIRLHKASRERFAATLSKEDAKKYLETIDKFIALRTKLLSIIKAIESGESGSKEQILAGQKSMQEYFRIMRRIEMKKALALMGSDAEITAVTEKSRNLVDQAMKLSQPYQKLEEFLLTKPAATDENKDELKKLISELKSALED